MHPSRKSRFINQGTYLSNRDSVASWNEDGLSNTKRLPTPKDIVAGLVFSNYSHENTTSLPGLKDIEAGPSHKESQDDFLKLQILRECTNWYAGDQVKAAGRLGIDQSAMKRSRLSFTPAMFQLGPGALSTAQTRELARVNTDSISEPSFKELDASSEPPDGGALAWAHAFAGHLVAFNVQGLNMSYGIFQAYYQNVMLPQNSPAQIAWIGSFQIFFIFFMSIIVSPLMDKGHFRACCNGGSILLVLSILATSFCTQWWQLLLVQGILTGISMGLIFGAGIIVLVSYFSTHMGLATGIAAAGSSTGGIIFPLMANHLIFKVGYAWTVRAIALVVLLTLIPANLIARERPGRSKKGATTMDWTIFRDIPYLLMMAGMFFSFWGVYFGFYYIATYGEEILHLSPSDSVNLLIAMNAANLPGRFIPNLISDACIGPLNTIIPSTFLAAMQIFVWVGTSTHASLLVVACLYGFSAAGLQGLYNATVYSFSPDRSKVGIRMALVFAVIGVACLTGAPVGGALINAHDGDYLYAQLFSGLSILVGGMFLLAARLVKSGWSAGRV